MNEMTLRPTLGMGGMLSRHERDVIQALLVGGVPAAAKALNMTEIRAEAWVAELMWHGDGRAYLAKMLDARAVGLLAPKAMSTVAALMDDERVAGRTRLAAAQLALQVVGLLRPGVDTTMAAKAAQQASQDVRMSGLDFAGLSAEERTWKGADLAAAREACPNRLNFAELMPKVDELLA